MIDHAYADARTGCDHDQGDDEEQQHFRPPHLIWSRSDQLGKKMWLID